MKKRILNLIMAFSLAIVGINAQTLSVASLNMQSEQETEIAVNIEGATAMTALQFNISLPQGVSYKYPTSTNKKITLGSAANGHTINVSELSSGSLLVVLYNTNLNTFGSGTLLRIPVVAGNKAVTAKGSIYTVRVSTPDAVSKECGNASFEVNVTVPVTGITLDCTTASLVEGDQLTLTATVSPDNATDKTVTWISSATNIATVENGVVTAVAQGTATITAKCGDKEATCVVTVERKIIPVTGITLDRTTASLVEGDQLTLTATVSPDNATDKTVTWISSATNIATVENGVVTAVAQGTATITAKCGDKEATCVVTVERKVIPVTGITLDRTTASLVEGDQLTLTATVSPDNATDKAVTWISSATNIATVENGVVTAVAQGTATITAKCGGKEATCVVTVTKKITGITDLSELRNNIVYHIYQPYHEYGETSWAVATGQAQLKSNKELNIDVSANDRRQQFAIVSGDEGDTYYLYHVAEKKFIGKDGSLSSVPTDAIKFKAGAYENTFVVYFDLSHYINVNNYQKIIIDNWSKADGGNSCVITAVGEFDPTEAINAFINTGIENVNGEQGEVTIYDLRGNRIVDVDNMEKGVYIVNGKKMFVK